MHPYLFLTALQAKLAVKCTIVGGPVSRIRFSEVTARQLLPWSRIPSPEAHANNIFRGSSMYSLTFTRNCTASLPSRSRWSYVRARYIIYGYVSKENLKELLQLTGLISTLPFTAIGRSLIAWRPNTAVCGRLMIGVPIIEPKTPPLLIVKLPPAISSMVSLLSRAWKAYQ